MRANLLVPLLPLLLLVPAPARGSALELQGLGARASGMGLAATATANGPEAVYYNPAGLASLSGIRFDAAYRDQPARLTMNGRSVGARDARASQLGLGFGLSTFGLPAGLAISADVPNTGLYGVRLRDPAEPQFVVVDERRDRAHAMVAFGIRPLDRLAIGIGVSLFADTIAQIGIDYGEKSGATMDATLKPTRTLHAGILAGPWRGVTAGLAYRAESSSVIAFPTTLHAKIGAVEGDVRVQSRNVVFFTPEQLALGAAKESGAWTITADLIAARWSRMRDPNGEQSVTVTGTPGLPPSPPAVHEEDPGFHDTLASRAGVEWRGPHAVALRGGWAFDPSPAPAPSPTRNLVDCTRHTLTAGAGITFREPAWLTGPLSLDTWAAWTHLMPRTVLRDDPTDPVGSYVAGGEMFSLGVSATFRFAAPYLAGGTS